MGLIASSKEQLEKNFQIANSFYDMANISINHDKYVILTNNPKFCNQEILMNVSSNKSITTRVASRSAAKRIFGIYITAFNTHTLPITLFTLSIAFFYQNWNILTSLLSLLNNNAIHFLLLLKSYLNII